MRLVFGSASGLARRRLDGSRRQRIHAGLEMRRRSQYRRQKEKQQDAAAATTQDEETAAAAATTTTTRQSRDEGFWMSDEEPVSYLYQ